MNKKQNRVLTIREVCGALQVSRNTLWRWIGQQKGLPVIRVGRVVRVDVTDLEEWLRNHKPDAIGGAA